MPESNEAIADVKRGIRDSMRRARRELPDRHERSHRIVEHLVGIGPVASASRLMVYTAVVGEVDLASLVDWATARQVEVAVPEDGVDPAWPDVIIVPGVAFTPAGERVGQGGGWYDRFLPARRPDALTIGVGFDLQVVAAVPTEPHDVVLDCIVTESGPRWRHD